MKLAFALLAALATVAVATTGKADYSQHMLLEVDVADRQVLRYLESLPFADVWGVRGNKVDVMLHQRDTSLLVPTLKKKVVVENVQAYIDAHAPPATRADWVVGRYGGFFNEFRAADEFNAYIDALVSNYSTILTRIEAGRTFEGNTIYGVRLATGGSNKPTFFIEANVHAREWLAPTTNLWVLTGLVEDYIRGTSPGNAMAAKFDWYIVPMVNMDGYRYTWSNDRLWRKNRRINEGSNAIGVDINRNWGPADTWCTSGSSKNPASDTYCGTGPFSEIETESMRNFIDTLPNLAAAIDYHCYGPLILYPFQYSYNSAPEPYNTLVTNLGQSMEAAIRSVYGYPFEAIQGSDLYPHSGGLIDYTYFQRGAPAFTVELRGNSFIVPASDIILSGEENYIGLLQLASDL